MCCNDMLLIYSFGALLKPRVGLNRNHMQSVIFVRGLHLRLAWVREPQAAWCQVFAVLVTRLDKHSTVPWPVAEAGAQGQQ